MRGDAREKIFVVDAGALLMIVIFDTNEEDWQAVLDQVVGSHLVGYSEEGAGRALPDIRSIFEAGRRRSVRAEIMLPGFTVNCHFFRVDRIEMDLAPEDVDSDEKADAVFELMAGFAALLSKEVFLIPEFGAASPDELRKKAVCVVGPHGSVRTLLE